MRIRRVSVNNRKRTVEIETVKGRFALPFAKLQVKPSKEDRIKRIFIDPELAHGCVTYVLESGRGDSIPVDAFLDHNRDPDYLRDIALHRLTIEALKLVKCSRLGNHELVRRLNTSSAQLRRLLDPANTQKTIDEMLRLFTVLGYRVDINFVKEAA